MDGFSKYMEQYDNVAFMAGNVPLILRNLEKAEQDNCLRQFIMNEKPYQCAFTFFVFNDNQQAARGKDQIAIVLALNLYGAKHPGFALRLNQTLKVLAQGSNKQAQAVLVLMAAQLELQEQEISLINFVDRELLERVNAYSRRRKKPMIALSLLYIVGGAIGMPGFTMAGLIPLTFGAIALFIYGFYSLPRWLGTPIFSEEVFARSVREPGDCVTLEDEEATTQAE